MTRQLDTTILFVIGNIWFLVHSNVYGFVVPTLTRYHRHSSTSIQEGIGVGIDLGTTHSAVSILKGGVPVILEIEGNGRTMPSVVYMDGDTILVGKQAIEREVDHPLGTYRNVKRVIGIGETAAHAVANVVPNLVIGRASREEVTTPKKKKWSKNKEKPPGLAKQILDAQENPTKLYAPPNEHGLRSTVSPEFISSQILRKLFETAEKLTNQTVDRAVIGVPAYFHDEQREATIRACQMAGVEKVRLLREPEAAALSYGVGKEQIGLGDMDELVLVFDLGGGTYDVSMLVVGGGLTEVISTSGDVILGGSDFDYRIAQHFSKVLRQHGVSKSFLAIPAARDAMVRAAEMVRIYLSNNRKAQLALPLREEGWTRLESPRDVILKEERDDLSEDGTKTESNVLVELSRKTMESLCLRELQALLRPLREVAIMAGALLPGDASPSAVEAALALEEEIEQAMQDSASFGDFYGSEGESSEQDIDPDMLLQLQQFDMKEAKKAQQGGRKKAREVAKEEKKFRAEKRKVGAAVSDVKVQTGINGRPISQVVLVGGATRMPAIGRLLSALTGVVPQRTVNPDEAVALGCAVQAGVLDGNAELGGLTVLTPMQGAIMRALAKQQGLLDDDPDFADFDADFDESEFEGGDVELIEF
ncbi:ATP binding protein [Fragilaria crotonensis]|nr:ATP binding protein [Fragilaria crotonensis]